MKYLSRTAPLSIPHIVRRIAFYLGAAILLTIVGILAMLLVGVVQLVSFAFGAFLIVMFVLAGILVVILTPQAAYREAREAFHTLHREGILRSLLVLATLYYLLYVLTAWAGWHRFPWPF